MVSKLLPNGTFELGIDNDYITKQFFMVIQGEML